MKLDKIYLSLALLISISLFSWITSCTHVSNIANIPEVCFTSDILPIFTANCAISGCHDGAGRESRMALNSYAEISSRVIAGNPNGSNLYQAIISKWGNMMPPNKPLSLDNRTKIRVWIEQGAQNTVCTDTTGTGGTGNPSYVNPRTCFTRDILPVLVSKCSMTGCHDAVSHKEGYQFISYATTMTAVSAGNPGGSRLYQAVSATSGEGRMPPSPATRLPQVLIDSIAAWIKYGAPNEFCGEVCDTISPVTFTGVIWPVIQSYCLDCHTTATPSNKSILLTNYAQISANAASGLLMNALTGNGVTKMPPSGSLTACKIRQFQIWINNGFPNN